MWNRSAAFAISIRISACVSSPLPPPPSTSARALAEIGNPATGHLELPQHPDELVRRVPPQHPQRDENFHLERRAGIGLRPLDQTVQGIVFIEIVRSSTFAIALAVASFGIILLAMILSRLPDLPLKACRAASSSAPFIILLPCVMIVAAARLAAARCARFRP